MSEEEQSAAPEPAPADPPPAPSGQIPGAEKKVLAGVLGIILGWVGVHKFILGYNKEGIIMAGVSIGGWILSFVLCFTAFFGTAMWIVGIVEGIIYLTKSDQEFVDTYVTGNKPWF